MTNLVTCECGLKVLSASLSRHRKSRRHEWLVEVSKTGELLRVSETKVVEVLKALGAPIIQLKTGARYNRYGRIYQLRFQKWSPRFPVWLATTLWVNLPWLKAVAVARDLKESDPCVLVLLRLHYNLTGNCEVEERLLAGKAKEMGFKWKYWKDSWDFSQEQEATGGEEERRNETQE